MGVWIIGGCRSRDAHVVTRTLLLYLYILLIHVEGQLQYLPR